jgi:hypothetical protein
MIKERRRGRASRPLDAGPLAITTRVRRLVDDVHGGNLVEASAFAGLPYHTFRQMHAGHRVPCRATLERLASVYDLPVDWFTSARQTDDGTIPLAGWIGDLPSDPSHRLTSEAATGRRVTSPVSAWPLIRVLAQLEQRLTALPKSPLRPIIGAATDPREIRRRLTAFILQPILAARFAGSIAPAEPGSPTNPEWVDLLRALGRFWERALSDLM